MTEAQLQDAIVGMARVLGWRVAHFGALRTADSWRTPARYDAAGFPDLVLVRDRVVFVEVKGHRGVLRPEQSDWARALGGAGAEWHLWTPASWKAGDVEAVLGARVRAAGGLEDAA